MIFLSSHYVTGTILRVMRSMDLNLIITCKVNTTLAAGDNSQTTIMLLFPFTDKKTEA